MADRGAIVVADPDAGFRSFVTRLFSGASYQVQGVERGEQALAEARERRPALVLLDVELPDLSGFEVCQQLRDEFGDEIPIVFVSSRRTSSVDRATGFLVGGDDHLVKPVDADELLARARRLISRVRRESRLRDPAFDSSLTNRELEVVRLLAAGKGTKEIARELVISPKTVASHLQHVLAKLGAHSRAEAVAIAYRDGFVDASAAGGDTQAVTAHVSATG